MNFISSMLQDTNGLESIILTHRHMSFDKILCLCNKWESLGGIFSIVAAEYQNL